MTRSRDAALARADAARIPLKDGSADLIVTSPPYFALRSYRDGDKHYDGQLGSESTPSDFLVALWTVLDECWRVLAPNGSCWVNLGDKYAGSGGHNNAAISDKSTLSGNGHQGGSPKIKATRRSAPDRYNQAADVVAKSLMGLPWRFALGLTCPDPYRTCYQPGDHPRWILRAETVWSKPNGLPESVTDRVRRSHEQWFMFTKQPRYFAGVDEVREGYAPGTAERYISGFRLTGAGAAGQSRNAKIAKADGGPSSTNPLGKLPGSVWSIPSEPLRAPIAFHSTDGRRWHASSGPVAWHSKGAVESRRHLWLRATEAHAAGRPLYVSQIDHFAAFPSALPAKIIAGWSPVGICEACGEARRAVVRKDRSGVDYELSARMASERIAATGGQITGGTARSTLGHGHDAGITATITGYACACPDTSAATTPAVVLDPFAGTGTTIMAARALGRYGIGLDISADYLRLAHWRVFESGHAGKVATRANREAQGALDLGPAA